MKTYIKTQLISVLVLLLVIFNACTEEYEKMNTSNSLVTEDLINVDLLFTRVQVQAIHFGSAYGNGTLGNYCGMNVRQDNRPFTIGDAPGVWNACYGDYARNLSDIINICKKRNEKNGNNALDNKIAMSRILKVWAFAEVTDTYGDIPYSESCLPVEDAIFQPKYDTQKDIYEDFFKELKEAAAQLDAGNDSYGSADLIYGGDVDKWKKLANSLRLRLALRVRYVDEAMAQSNMSDLSEANLITSLEDDAFINSADDYNSNMNRLYDRLITNGYPGSAEVGKTLEDIMSATNDPRIAVYMDTAYAQWPGTPGYEDIPSFGYRGKPLLGFVPVEEKYPWGAETTSQWSAFWYTPIIERPLMRSSEVYFALAEAALFGLKQGDANALYKKGLDQALAWAQKLYANGKPQMPPYLGIFYSKVYPDWDETWEPDYWADKEMTQAEIATYKAGDVYTLSGSQEEKLEMIMNQKMIALYPMEEQGWFEWRRTGYPRVLVGDDGDALKGVSPRRMPWPQNEQSVNSANYEQALQRIGGVDGRLQKVWWDANPAAPHKHPGKVPWMDHPWI
ncbi:Cell surface glycan-binding lipoprotein, utilization system for glycans and polysaccharides (PUL), SusD family [hydrothermal vent metagenome]|uniref:Cell surface glycan-binding lipoprotein, utilization system for glycans and polysaccharides (PUL), SusD family n=1 Tax=hydrothermal vent metagenome TaxID=652676 RepID=A0A3B0UU09_9ZZZZ